MRKLLLITLAFILFNSDRTFATSDERNKEPAEEQGRLIDESLHELNHILAEGRARQTGHAILGKKTARNAILAKGKIETTGLQMKHVKDIYDDKVGKWIAEGPSKNAAVPNKGEKPLHLTASRSMREASQLHTHWVSKSNWPSPEWNKEYLSHHRISAQQVSQEAAHQIGRAHV